jgi:hypothetical protein
MEEGGMVSRGQRWTRIAVLTLVAVVIAGSGFTNGGRAVAAQGSLASSSLDQTEVTPPGLAAAAVLQESWLDNPSPVNWNVSGAPVPLAPPPEMPVDPRFAERNRSPETPADEQLVAAGWQLFTGYQAGWGIMVVPATSGFDGMGRPWGYQMFVFVNTVYAGTLSPTLMNARTDGALIQASVTDFNSISADFQRYASTDALCCPSGSALVLYDISFPPSGAVVAPTSASTQWTGARSPGHLIAAVTMARD